MASMQADPRGGASGRGSGRGEAAALTGLAALLASVALVGGCGGGPEEPPGERTGFLRLPEDSGEVHAAEVPPRRPGAGEARSDAPRPMAAAEDRGAPSAPAPSGAGAYVDDASDLDLAADLLRRSPAAFAQSLERRGAALQPDRRRMLLAFAAARGGQLEDAARLADGLDASSALTPGEQRLLGEALAPAGPRPIAATLASGSPLERAMEMVLLGRSADALARAGDAAGAARALSRLLLAELDSPWPTDREVLARWSDELTDAQARHRWNPRGDWPSITVTVQEGDSLIGIRKRVLEAHPELLLCTGLIAKANGLASETAIRPGDELRIPTDRASALVDVDARWTLYLLGDEVVAAWEVGVGKEAGATRAGDYTVGDKQVEPMWFQPGRDPVPYGAPENPLGTRWLAWFEDGKSTSLGFHGTSDPDGVGGRVSQGCIRMRNQDVELLFDILPRGAAVRVQP